jgi:DNA mismatch repair ATPase MutS
VAVGFAQLAEELNFSRPTINDGYVEFRLQPLSFLNVHSLISLNFSITNGRHPTVELGLLKAGRNFMPNSSSLRPESRLHVITGPNMAGKFRFGRLNDRV